MMKADVLNAFLGAASRVLTQEISGPVRRTGLLMDPSDSISDEVTVYVALVGQVRGMVLVGMSLEAARAIVSRMVDEPQLELTEMGLSALAELGNLIAGGTCIQLEKLNLPTDITPPTIMIGHRSRLSTLGLPRFVIPLETACGIVRVHVSATLVA